MQHLLILVYWGGSICADYCQCIRIKKVNKTDNKELNTHSLSLVDLCQIEDVAVKRPLLLVKVMV